MHASIAPLLLLALSASASPMAQHRRHAHPENQIGQPIDGVTTAPAVQPATTNVAQPGGPPGAYTTLNGDGKKNTAQTTETTCTEATTVGGAKPTMPANDGIHGMPPGVNPPSNKGADDGQWHDFGPWGPPQQGPPAGNPQQGPPAGNPQQGPPAGNPQQGPPGYGGSPGNTAQQTGATAQATGHVKPTQPADGANAPGYTLLPGHKEPQKGHEPAEKTVTVTVSNCGASPTNSPPHGDGNHSDGKNGVGKHGDGKNGNGDHNDGKNGNGNDDGKNNGNGKGNGKNNGNSNGQTGATTALTAATTALTGASPTDGYTTLQTTQTTQATTAQTGTFTTPKRVTDPAPTIGTGGPAVTSQLRAPTDATTEATTVATTANAANPTDGSNPPPAQYTTQVAPGGTATAT